MKNRILVFILAISLITATGCGAIENGQGSGEGGTLTENQPKEDTQREKEIKEKALSLLKEDKPIEAAELVQSAIEEEASESLEVFLQDICDHTVITEMITTYDDGSETVKKFDDFGRILLGQSKYFKEEHERDAQGNEICEKYYDESGKLYQVTDYEYVDKDKIKSFITKNEEGKVQHGCDYEYNAKGNITKIVYYGAEKRKNSETEYIYDAEKQKGTKSTYYDEKEKVKYTTTVEYDENGNISVLDTVYTDGKREYTSYQREYDEHDNIIKYRGYDENGKLKISEDSVYEYDKNGNSVKKDTTDHLNDVVYHMESVYDDESNLLSRKLTYDDSEAKGAFDQYYTMEYDSMGRLTRCVDYDWDFTTPVLEQTTVYAEDGSYTVTTTENRSGVTSVFVSETNRYGLLIREKSDDDYEYIYEYDALRNMIKTKENGKVSCTVISKYHYNPEVESTNISGYYEE